MSDPELVAAVKSAKRTALYRGTRHRLTCPAPDEVWADSSIRTTFVVFSVRGQSQRLLGFAVAERTHAVIDAGIVSITVADNQWKVRNEGLTADRSEDDAMFG